MSEALTLYTDQSRQFMANIGFDPIYSLVHDPRSVDGKSFGYEEKVEYDFTRIGLIVDGMFVIYDEARLEGDSNSKYDLVVKGGGTSLAEANVIFAQKILETFTALGRPLPRSVKVTSQEGGLPRIKLGDLGINVDPEGVSSSSLRFGIPNANKLHSAACQIVPSLALLDEVEFVAYSAGFKGALEAAANNKKARVLTAEPVGNVGYTSNLAKRFGLNPVSAYLWNLQRSTGFGRVGALFNLNYGLSQSSKAWVTPTGNASIRDMVQYSLMETPYARQIAESFGVPRDMQKLLQSCKPNTNYLRFHDADTLRRFQGDLVASVGYAGISVFLDPVKEALNTHRISDREVIEAIRGSDIEALERINAIATAVLKPNFPNARHVTGIVDEHHMHAMSKTKESIDRLFGIWVQSQKRQATFASPALNAGY